MFGPPSTPSMQYTSLSLQSASLLHFHILCGFFLSICGGKSFTRCHALQDEYCGMQPDDLQSYHHFMNVHLFDHLSDIERANIHIPDGTITSAADIRR